MPSLSPSRTLVCAQETRYPDLLHLIFFNKSSADILMSSSWDRLIDVDPKRFRIDHVLSNPDPEWTGTKGRVSKEMLLRLLTGTYTSISHASLNHMALSKQILLREVGLALFSGNVLASLRQCVLVVDLWSYGFFSSFNFRWQPVKGGVVESDSLVSFRHLWISRL